MRAGGTRLALFCMAWAMSAWLAPASAAEPQPFTAESLAAIQARYAGKPFILSLWSVNWCGHCITELTLLGKVARTHKQLPLVLVSTDSPESAPSIQKTLRQLGLASFDSWVFADDIPERPRHAVDPGWYGEVPRTYLYDANHRRETVAGVLSEQKLRAWLKKNN